MKNILDLYNNLEQSISKLNYIDEVQLDEDFIPPHKQAGFVPYDAVLLANDPPDGELDVSTVEELLDASNVHYTEVLSVEEHEMYYDCKYIVYISLV